MLNYERLSRIVKDTKPYRKTKKTKDNRDRYPLDWRKHGGKCFFVSQDANGDNEYHITYAHQYVEHAITKERHDEIIANKGWGARDRGNGVYTEWVTEWNTIGIVRKDNTLEFTTDRLHQGTRFFLTNMFGRYYSAIVSSVKHGGVIYREFEREGSDGWKDKVVIPLFKGQRINLETNRSVLDYEVHLPYVNKERSRAVMSEFKKELKVAEIFFKTMTGEVFTSELREVYDEVYEGKVKPNWRGSEAKEIIDDFAERHFKTDIYKAMYAVMMASGVWNAWNIGSGSPYYNKDSINPHGYFCSAKQKFYKALKLSNNVLDDKVYKANETYPSNAWGVKVLVDGNEVRAY